MLFSPKFWRKRGAGPINGVFQCKQISTEIFRPKIDNQELLKLKELPAGVREGVGGVVFRLG